MKVIRIILSVFGLCFLAQQATHLLFSFYGLAHADAAGAGWSFLALAGTAYGIAEYETLGD